MDTLKQLGISMQEVADKLLAEGLQLFSDAFDKLLAAVEKQSRSAGAGKVNRLT
jgi:transaldolase